MTKKEFFDTIYYASIQELLNYIQEVNAMAADLETSEETMTMCDIYDFTHGLESIRSIIFNAVMDYQHIVNKCIAPEPRKEEKNNV